MIIVIFEVLTLFLVILVLIQEYKKRSKRKRSHLALAKNVWQQREESFISAKHTWTVVQKQGMTYCNICRKLMGIVCRSTTLDCIKCNLSCHPICSLKAEQKLKCQFVVGTKETAFNPHQWVEGNLPINSSCSHCGLIAGSYYCLEGYHCIWCHQIAHQDCREKMNDTCDFGYLSKTIIRPNFIRYIPQNKELPQFLLKFQQKIVKPVPVQTSESDTDLDNQMKEPSNWKFMIPPGISPIVVVINQKSGGQIGMEVLRQFYRFLNPLQVIDLLEEGLDRLKIFANINNLRIVACGGDGTAASVVNYIKSCDVQSWKKRNPSVGVLPLGTGNDLSRSLGWGGGYQGNDSLRELILEYIYKSETVMFDRWKVNIFKIGQKKDDKIMDMTMYNYCSIGLDAKFCLGFHNLREKYPYLFKTQIGNKFIYSHLGANDIIKGKRVNLAQICSIKCDEKEIFIPDVENIVVVNINSWAGGATNFWPQQDGSHDHMHLSEGTSDFKLQSSPNQKLEVPASTATNNQKESKSSHSSVEEDQTQKITEKQANRNNLIKVDQFKPMSSQDGIIQVIGVTSVLHLGQIQVGLDSPIRICQGRHIEICIEEVSKKHAFQVDGEPYEFESPFKFVVSLEDQTMMLSNSKNSGGQQWEEKIIQTLEWAILNKTITSEQKDVLFEKLLM